MDFRAGGVSGGIGGFGTRAATVGACAIEAPVGRGAHRCCRENDLDLKDGLLTPLTHIQHTYSVAL